jgi:hypothetical protein
MTTAELSVQFASKGSCRCESLRKRATGKLSMAAVTLFKPGKRIAFAKG